MQVSSSGQGARLRLPQRRMEGEGEGEGDGGMLVDLGMGEVLGGGPLRVGGLDVVVGCGFGWDFVGCGFGGGDGGGLGGVAARELVGLGGPGCFFVFFRVVAAAAAAAYMGLGEL